MPSFILFDDPALHKQLLPFTYTRPVAGIRCGIHTIARKWTSRLSSPVSFLTETYLADKFPAVFTDDNILINGAVCPDDALIAAILVLAPESVLKSADGTTILAARTSGRYWSFETDKIVSYTGDPTIIRQIWDIFLQNGKQIVADFALTKNQTSAPLDDPHTRCYNQSQIFIEPGAKIRAAVLNAEDGPIYIGKNAVIQEGASIQGPFAMNEGATVAQNAKVRPNTTIGPFCKIGGEVSNSVLFGYSNKGHEGYLGNAVLGEWCNLGANTNNSNLKNDHTHVKLHSYVTGRLESTGLTNCGLFMGDYSKAGISTMFNTGTVVGVSVNVFGAGFQPKHIPSFSWGGKAEGFTTYRLEKAMAVVADTQGRRSVTFDEKEAKLMDEVFHQTASQRTDY